MYSCSDGRNRPCWEGPSPTSGCHSKWHVHQRMCVGRFRPLSTSLRTEYGTRRWFSKRWNRLRAIGPFLSIQLDALSDLARFRVLCTAGPLAAGGKLHLWGRRSRNCDPGSRVGPHGSGRFNHGRDGAYARRGRTRGVGMRGSEPSARAADASSHRRRPVLRCMGVPLVPYGRVPGDYQFQPIGRDVQLPPRTGGQVPRPAS